ncbi:hypothetical protein E2C01_052892 [Portunus trituberculatus]|uniref:Uncharacterized protein n=1 Tax=Portunus trituberculatus TaxID=210409 RepID=A0A5B7GIX3_PORTR|nr:hypothetical protein [Portunus trituberculatus]
MARLTPHLTLRLRGYHIMRQDHPQGCGSGILLVLCDSLTHLPLTLPPWPGGHMEIASARVCLPSGWFTEAVCYNPGGTTHWKLGHYFSLPSPVIIMGDVIAHHSCWDTHLSPHQRNQVGNALFQVVMDSPPPVSPQHTRTRHKV